MSAPAWPTGTACRTYQPFRAAHRFSLRPTSRSPFAPIAKDPADRYATASELAVELVQLLGQPSPPPAIFLYWDELDLVHHLRARKDLHEI